MGTIQPVHVGHVLIQMLALATLVVALFILYGASRHPVALVVAPAPHRVRGDSHVRSG